MLKRLMIFCLILFVMIFTGITVANAQDFWGFNPLELELEVNILEFEKDHAFVFINEEIRSDSLIVSYYFTELFGSPIFMIVIIDDNLVTGISLMINDVPESDAEEVFEYLDNIMKITNNNWMFWSFYEETELSYKIIWSRAYYDYVLAIILNFEIGSYDFILSKLKRFIIKVPYENRRIEEDES